MMEASPIGIGILGTSVFGSISYGVFLWLRHLKNKAEKEGDETTEIRRPARAPRDSGLLAMVQQFSETMRDEGRENRRVMGEMFGLLNAQTTALKELILETRNTRDHFDQLHDTEQKTQSRIENGIERIRDRIDFSGRPGFHPQPARNPD